MPMTEDGVFADILFNQSTMYNRENSYQLNEMSLTRIGQQLLRYIENNHIDADTGIDMIIKFIRFANPVQAEKLENWVSQFNEDDRDFLLECLIKDDSIMETVQTMHDVMTIDDMAAIYKEFPFLTQTKVFVSIADSNGNIRRIPARRKVVMGKEYILRLKKYNQHIWKHVCSQVLIAGKGLRLCTTT